MGHWYQEAFRETPHYRFEIEYYPDGRVSGFQWDRAFAPDGTPRDSCMRYEGTWQLVGTTLTHSWTVGAEYDTVPDPAECDVLRLTRSDMQLRDRVRGFYLLFHRNLRFAPKRPNQAMQLTASKPDVQAWSVCRRHRMLRGMHRGLAAADLVSR